MPASKKCSSCGAPVPDDKSVFCNRCGARLPATGPADGPTCRKCGRTVSDRQSHFCDRCGSPLAPAEQPLPPVVPAVRPIPPVLPAEKVTVCPTCGFKNPGENRFYCKKCGVYIPKKKPARQRGREEPAPVRGPQGRGIRTRQDGVDAVRQRPATVPAAGGKPPAGVTVQPRKRAKKSPEKSPRSYRRIALVAAGVIILLLIVAVLTGNIPGIPGAGPANATAPGLFDKLLSGILPNQTPPINKALPVVTDTPLKP